MVFRRRPPGSPRPPDEPPTGTPQIAAEPTAEFITTNTGRQQPPAYAAESARGPIDLPTAPRRGAAEATTVARNERKLMVGGGISLAGEIAACDHLVVIGRIEVKIRDCQTLEVTESGIFSGSADIQEADIGGRFDGELKVRGRLRLRGTGQIAGNVSYGELLVEPGGRLSGTLEPLAVTPLRDAGLPDAG